MSLTTLVPAAGPGLRHSLLRAAIPLARRSLAPARRNLFTIVEQGHEAWRLSLGRNPVKLEPGMSLALPLYHSVQHVDLRETSINVADLTAFTSDNVPVLVSGSLFFCVKNSYNACFSISDFQANVKNIGTSATRSVVGSFAYDDVIGDRNRINSKLRDVIGTSVDKWGIECTKFEIQNFKPSNRDVEKQLELQMQAERERRKQILDTQALVNVAEGHKQRSILESEGELQSQLNRATGEKQKRILESEGAREATLNDGRALAEQVDIIARTLSAADGPPTEDARRQALETLLQLRRIEQLNSIALGKGNTTYFFGERAGSTSYEVENAEKWKKSLLRPSTAAA